MGFYPIWDENVPKANTPEESQQAVTATTDLCIEKGYLIKCLEEQRLDLEKIMMTMFSPKYAKATSERTEKIQEAIAFDSDDGFNDDQIKSAIICFYVLTLT